MKNNMLEELTQFWMKQYSHMTYTKARKWALEQVDEAENGEG